MFEPEISRRCRGCGASVRARARFCPQCGLDVGDKAVTESGGLLKTETMREPVAPKEKAAEAVESPEQRRRAPVRALAGAAREKAEEQIGPRVEKIRQASNVVIDEAAEDPEVRFLLIAAVLFILFVVIFFVTTFFIK